MERTFIDSFIPDANFRDFGFAKGIQCYEYCDTIYVLVNTEIVGLITQRLKKEISKKLQLLSKPILYISIFKKRTDFIEPDKIAWDSYVWCEDNPKHFIHFEKNSKGVRPYPTIARL